MTGFVHLLAAPVATKPELDLGASAGSGSPWMPVIIVLALLALGARWALRRGMVSVGHRRGTELVVRETVPLGAGQVAVVEAHGVRCLVGVTAGQITHLADLPYSQHEAFLDVLEAVEGTPPSAPVEARFERLRLT
jgi:flagellar biogenesis protein FliO